MGIFFDEATHDTRPLRLLHAREPNASLASWLEGESPAIADWVKHAGYTPRPNRWLMLPTEGRPSFIAGDAGGRYDLSDLPLSLPVGRYALEGEFSPDEADRLALSWALGAYQFERYSSAKRAPARLLWPKGARPKRVIALYEAVFLARALITTPAEDLGPEALAEEAKGIAAQHGAEFKQWVGPELLEANFPTIFAVGRAASRAPRLIEVNWGPLDAPRLSLVGKGVVFDSGGLDLKPAAGMRLMKKDMGGAAILLGLSQAIMAMGLRIRLQLLIPAVENAISGHAIRPGDVIRTRKGLTVEVGNTDAEGRLILADALAYASEGAPQAIVDMATLTGAARIALGTELPALFASCDALAGRILEGAAAAQDPLWRMPLHAPYQGQLKSRVADLNNISSSSFGGAITAALFLQHFVGENLPWAHIDVMAWNSEPQPGRPVGGEAMGLAALFHAIEAFAASPE